MWLPWNKTCWDRLWQVEHGNSFVPYFSMAPYVKFAHQESYWSLKTNARSNLTCISSFKSSLLFQVTEELLATAGAAFWCTPVPFCWSAALFPSNLLKPPITSINLWPTTSTPITHRGTYQNWQEQIMQVISKTPTLQIYITSTRQI